MRERNLSLDVIRCIACIMVVIMHAPIPGIGTSGWLLSAISFLTAPCIGLFIMLSGSLLLPIQEPVNEFMNKRIKKVFFPTLFWSLFYIVVGYIMTERRFEAVAFLKQLFSIPFSAQGNGVMWFMYMIGGLYLATPILSAWVKTASKCQLRFYLILWGITLLYPILQEFVHIDQSKAGILFYFSGYVGYYLLGYYLKRYVRNIRRIWIFLLFLMPISVAVIFKLFHVNVDFYEFFWYLSIFVVMMSSAWYLLITSSNISRSIRKRMRAFIVNFSNYSLGIYLIHIFIMRQIIWHCPFCGAIGGAGQIILTVIATLLVSYVIVAWIARTPFANYLIGYKIKK
jgi:surface polysaccharide O-acyltransferase-like enzyme